MGTCWSFILNWDKRAAQHGHKSERRTRCLLYRLRVRTALFFLQNFDEVWPLNWTVHFGQNGAGAASDLSTPRLSPSSSGTQKYVAHENSPMCTCGIHQAPKAIASSSLEIFFHILGCQIGGVALTRIYTVLCGVQALCVCHSFMCPCPRVVLHFTRN